MAAGVLIKQCVEEHQPGLVDWGFFRNECNLAEHRSAVIHGEHLFQNFLALLCVAVNDSSVLEINGKVVDDLSGPAERFGGNEAAFAFAAHRAGENFLGRHIRNVEGIVHMVDITSAAPFCARDQFNGKISAVFAGVVQFMERLLIQPVGFLGHAVTVCLPDFFYIFAFF